MFNLDFDDWSVGYSQWLILYAALSNVETQLSHSPLPISWLPAIACCIILYHVAGACLFIGLDHSVKISSLTPFFNTSAACLSFFFFFFRKEFYFLYMPNGMYYYILGAVFAVKHILISVLISYNREIWIPLFLNYLDMVYLNLACLLYCSKIHGLTRWYTYLSNSSKSLGQICT